jgi:hypothetical protein
VLLVRRRVGRVTRSWVGVAHDVFGLDDRNVA